MDKSTDSMTNTNGAVIVLLSMIIGIISVFIAFCFPILGLPLGVLALTLGIIGTVKKYYIKGIAITGIATGACSLLIGIVICVLVGPLYLFEPTEPMANDTIKEALLMSSEEIEEMYETNAGFELKYLKLSGKVAGLGEDFYDKYIQFFYDDANVTGSTCVYTEDVDSLNLRLGDEIEVTGYVLGFDGFPTPFGDIDCVYIHGDTIEVTRRIKAFDPLDYKAPPDFKSVGFGEHDGEKIVFEGEIAYASPEGSHTVYGIHTEPFSLYSLSDRDYSIKNWKDFKKGDKVRVYGTILPGRYAGIYFSTGFGNLEVDAIEKIE